MSAKTTKAETAETETVKAGEAKEAAKTDPKTETKPETKPAKEKCGFCVYMGPTIRAAIQRGTIFDTNRDKTNAKGKTFVGVVRRCSVADGRGG